MLRIGSCKKGVYILTTKDMKRIERALVDAEVETRCAKDFVVFFGNKKSDDKFDYLKFTKEKLDNAYNILENLYRWVAWHML